MVKNIIKKEFACPDCHNIMNLKQNKKYMDTYYWRCKKNGSVKHDSKINIRKESILEKLNVNIRVLYFLLFYCFVENKGLNQSYKKVIEFCKDLKLKNIKNFNNF